VSFSFTCETNVSIHFSSAPQLADLKLVIGGRRGWLYEEIFAAIERLHLGQQICALDYVDDNDLPALYNLADVFAYPSVYEGFGLPALEALACGTPVLTADNSSLPEAVGDAAVLVPAGDVDAIAAGLARLLADPALRARLRAAGPLRARQFTWARAAQQVLECYRQVIPSK
jgi:glycosyltransferase involved in cell wall biosynthesis